MEAREGIADLAGSLLLLFVALRGFFDLKLVLLRSAMPGSSCLLLYLGVRNIVAEAEWGAVEVIEDLAGSFLLFFVARRSFFDLLGNRVLPALPDSSCGLLCLDLAAIAAHLFAAWTSLIWTECLLLG